MVREVCYNTPLGVQHTEHMQGTPAERDIGWNQEST